MQETGKKADCLNCHFEMDIVGMQDQVEVEKDDVAMCLNCGTIMKIEMDYSVRQLTDEELEFVMNAPAWPAMVNVQNQIKQRNDRFNSGNYEVNIKLSGKELATISACLRLGSEFPDKDFSKRCHKIHENVTFQSIKALGPRAEILLKSIIEEMKDLGMDKAADDLIQKH